MTLLSHFLTSNSPFPPNFQKKKKYIKIFPRFFHLDFQEDLPNFKKNCRAKITIIVRTQNVYHTYIYTDRQTDRQRNRHQIWATRYPFLHYRYTFGCKKTPSINRTIYASTPLIFFLSFLCYIILNLLALNQQLVQQRHRLRHSRMCTALHTLFLPTLQSEGPSCSKGV